MDLYIDLSMVINILLSICILLSIKILTAASFNKFLSIIYVILHSLYVFLIYMNPILSHIIFISISIIFLFLLSKRNRLTNIFLYFFFYYGFGFILSYMNKGIIFKNSVILLTNTDGILLSLLIPIFGICMYISSLIIDKTFHLYNYKSYIYLTINNIEKRYSSYFDTGNTLKVDNIPVIFLSSKEVNINKSVFSKKVLVETIKGQEEVYLTKALIRKKDEKEYYFVYVGLKRDDLGFEGCEVLLNAYLF